MPGDSSLNDEPINNIYVIPHHQLSEPNSPPQKRRKRLRPLSTSEVLKAELNEMNYETKTQQI